MSSPYVTKLLEPHISWKQADEFHCDIFHCDQVYSL